MSDVQPKELPRAAILRTALETVTKSRVDVHGKPENTFARIADYWSVYLGEQLDASDVAAMMVLFKIARFQVTPGHLDNSVDGAGYFAIAGELATQGE